MCSVVILRRPGHEWPVIFAANRDEMGNRPWLPPGRHWPDRPQTVAGLDKLAGGSWLGLNDHGLIAGIMNRMNSLGPSPGKRSRGELVLEALDHADASEAAKALASLDPAAYRPFNLVLADNRDAFWLANLGERLRLEKIPAGLSMITAQDRNDTAHSRRIRHFLPRFERAAMPDPAADDWHEWEQLMASRDFAGRRQSLRCDDHRGRERFCDALQRADGAAGRRIAAQADLAICRRPARSDHLSDGHRLTLQRLDFQACFQRLGRPCAQAGPCRCFDPLELL